MSKKQGQDESAYAGRWVARVQGKIIGQGGTPEAARRAASGHRHKERPEISYVPTTLSPALSPLLDTVALAARDQEIYLVGGSVRDSLLGRVSHDLDLVVAKDAIGLARRAAASLGADFYVLDEGFDAARVIVTAQSGIRDVLDFTSFRGRTITDDLESRDFTINAIALELKSHTTLDPVQGAEDLRAKTIRACSPTALQDDPIRVLRAVRLAAELGFRIEPATRRAMKTAASQLLKTSPERQRDELFKILGGPRPDASLRAMEMLGVLPYFLPELADLKGVRQTTPHVHDAWEHTLSVMHHLAAIMDLLLDGKLSDANGILVSLLTLGIGRYRPQLGDHFAKDPDQNRTLRALMEFSALYHDVGKPSAMSVDSEGLIHFVDHKHGGAQVATHRAHQFNLSNAEIARIETIIDHHLRFFLLATRMEEHAELPSRRAIYRFCRDTGESAVDVILLGLADLWGTREHNLTEKSWSAWVDVARELMENLWEKPTESVTPPRLVNGTDLMQVLGLEPGPAVGELLEAIREGQATGSITTREAALEFGRDWMMKKDM
jgi:poly(A) polymerase